MSASFAFGRERRIRRRADFVHVQTNGERATSRHFVMLVCARDPVEKTAEVTPQIGPSRLGIVATRKVGDATMRNRIKRLCRECFRLWPGFVPDGIDLVVIAREGASELTLDRVRDEWSRARPALLKRCTSVLSGTRPPPEPKRRTPRKS
jgi:ribonuclease P protein component